MGEYPNIEVLEPYNDGYERLKITPLPRFGQATSESDPRSKNGGFYCLWCLLKQGVARPVWDDHLVEAVDDDGRVCFFGVCKECEITHYAPAATQAQTADPYAGLRPDEVVFPTKDRTNRPLPVVTMALPREDAVQSNGWQPKVLKGCEPEENHGRKERVHA